MAIHNREVDPTIIAWLNQRPGPFAARTEESVMKAAWANFNEGRVGSIETLLEFRFDLGKAKVRPRQTLLGGWVLDREVSA